MELQSEERAEDFDAPDRRSFDAGAKAEQPPSDKASISSLSSRRKGEVVVCSGGELPERVLTKWMQATQRTNPLVKRKIDYVIASNSPLPYVQKFLRTPFVSTYRQHPAFWSFWNHNELKKEMTEAYSVYKKLKQLLRILTTTHPEIQHKDIAIIDICSGKGYSSTLISFKFPESKVYMVDKDHSMNISHVACLSNVEVVRADIFTEEFVRWLAETASSKCVFFIGTHLCGALSLRFVELFNKLSSVRGMVLAPCCLSKTLKQLTMAAKRLKVDNYIYWSTHLYHCIRCDVSKNMIRDDDVLSTRNVLLLAHRMGKKEEPHLVSTTVTPVT